jgi:hypothetical protein
VKILVSPVFYLIPSSIFDFRRPIVYKICSWIPFHAANSMKSLLESADRILPNSLDEAKQIQSIF